MTKQAQKAHWGLKVTKSLKGKTVGGARYMSEEEREHFGWHSCAVFIWFTDGSWIMPSMDDEGNDAGAMFTSDENLEVIPVIG